MEVVRSVHVPYTEDELKNEIWKRVDKNPLYSISNLGRIKRRYDGNLREMHINNDGYVNCNITTSHVHRLVALAFIPNPDNKETVNHKDGNKQNNRDWNLEWNSRKENTNHAVESGLWTNNHIVEVYDIINKKTTKFMSINRMAKGINVDALAIIRFIKHSKVNPVLGRYNITLGKDIFKPINSSGRLNTILWVYDLIDNSWKEHFSWISVSYETTMHIALGIKKLLTNDYFIYGGYLICNYKNDEFIPITPDINYYNVSRNTCVNNKYIYKENIIYYLRDNFTKEVLEFSNLSPMCEYINTNIKCGKVVSNQQLISCMGRSRKSNHSSIIKGYDVKSSANDVHWLDRSKKEIISSRYDEDCKGTVIEYFIKDDGPFYVFGNKNIAKLLSTDNIKFSKEMVRLSLSKDSFHNLVTKSNAPVENVRLV